MEITLQGETLEYLPLENRLDLYVLREYERIVLDQVTKHVSYDHRRPKRRICHCNKHTARQLYDHLTCVNAHRYEYSKPCRTKHERSNDDFSIGSLPYGGIT